MLEHHAAIVAAAIDFTPVYGHAAPARRIEPHRNPKRGGLAATGRADQRDDLAVLDREADPVKRLHMVHLAIHAQRKTFGDVEETHLTHSELRIYFSDR